MTPDTTFAPCGFGFQVGERLCVAVCCSVLQYAAERCSVLQSAGVCCSVVQSNAE